MGRVTKVTCDSCKREISRESYQTMSIRRYHGENHEKVLRLPALWVCDKCYKRMALYMAFPPYDEVES